MKRYNIPLLLLLCYCCWPTSYLSAQPETDCESDQPITQGEILFNFGGATDAFNFTHRSTFSIGQPYTEAGLSSKNISAAGFWSLFLLPPQAPYVLASSGDFPDRIEVSWTPEPVSSAASGGYKILRDGSFLAKVDAETNQFIDFFIQPGEYYEYSVVGLNPFGEGYPGKSVGFINPNGVVTGKVTTNSGNPVPGVVVTLEPSFSNSLAFDGEGANVCMNYSDSIPKDMFTLSTWVKIGDTHDSDGLIDFGSDLNKNYWIHTTPSGAGKGVVLGIGDGTNANEITYEFETGADDWHHVTMVYGGGTLLLYIDGMYKKSMASAIATEAALFKLGSRRDETGFLDGWLDDMRLYNRLLSQTEIITTKNITVSKFTEGLVAYWKFDEGLGTKIFDLSFNKINGLLNGVTFSEDSPKIQNAGITNSGGTYAIEGVNYSQEQTFIASAAKDFYDNFALEFNAAYAARATLKNFDLTDTATIEVVVHPFELERRQSILSKMDGSTTQFELSIENNKYYLTLNGERQELGAATAEYRHLTFTLDALNNEVIYYVDAYEAGKKTLSFSNINITGGADWQLGALGMDSPTNYYTGLVDEVVFYDTILTISTIQNNASLAIGTDSGNGSLISYFSLNEESGTQIYDFVSSPIDTGSIKNASFSIITRQQKTSPHAFEPNNRLVTLNESGTSVGEVDFRDISTIPMSGIVRFSNTFCFQDSIEILVNGASNFPPIKTDANGRFSADFEPGASIILTPKYEDHQFAPPFFEWRKLKVPLAGILFQNQTKRKVEGQVFGGKCRLSIIPTDAEGIPTAIVKVKARALNGCFEETIQLDNAEGEFSFDALPPIPMAISIVEHSNSAIDDYFQIQGGQETDLRTIEGDTIDFKYISAPNVEIGEIDNIIPIECGTNLPLVYESPKFKPLKEYHNEIRVYEIYEGVECYLDSFNLTIDNGLQESPQQELSSDTSFYLYEYYINNPNLLDDHVKSMQVVAEVNGATATATYEAIVLGERQKENTIATRSPSKIFAILHDPPGDGSSATWAKGEGRCETWEDIDINTETLDGSLGAKIGTKLATFVGLGAGTIMEAEVSNTLTFNTSFSASQTTEDNGEFCWELNKEISTSDGDDIFGQHADVYFGAALNFEIGARDVLDFDFENCSFIDTVVLNITPTGEFATEFVYTEWQILTEVIPNLRATGNSRDAIEADRWLDEVNKNRARVRKMESSNPVSTLSGKFPAATDENDLNENIEEVINGLPLEAKQNITFDAGATYTQSLTSSQETSHNFTWDIDVGGSIDTEFETKIFGAGFDTKISVGYSHNFSESETTTQTNEITTEFTLADDDISDFYSVDIAYDPEYGTPMFNLIGGASMCPWIPGTRNREEVSMTVDAPIAINVPSNTPAVFHLTLGNIGQNGNDGLVYELGVDEGGNPDGALIKVDGQPLITPIEFQFIGTSSYSKTLTVEYPNTGQFDFEDLGIYFASVCQIEHSESVGYDAGDGGFLIYDEYAKTTGENYYSRFYKGLELDVHFIEPCSPIDISNPKQNDVIKIGEEVVNITLNEYVNTDPDLELVRLQYRPFPGDGSWINIMELAKSEFTNDPVFKIVQWDMSELKDGNYQLRAITQCFDVSLAPGISEVILLTKSTLPPEVFGLPEPADGILHKGDEISVIFNKSIDCDLVFEADFLNENNVGLYDTETGRLVTASYACVDNKIIITPAESERPFIENRLLGVKMKEISDLFGNQTGVLFDPVKFEFLVNRSDLNWEGLNIEENTEIGQSLTVVREISNQGSTIRNYTIEDIPSWMIVNPSEGAINPGERIEINFTFPANLTINDYNTTVILDYSLSEQPLDVMLRVRCPSPSWVFNRVNDFENTENFTLQIDLFGEISTDPTDMVAAFINGEIRGVANIQYIRPLDKYIAFLTVYGDEGSDVPIDLRIWDASNCTVYPETIEKFNYIQGEIIGRLGEPQVLHVENVVERKISLSPGWNWISVNVDLIDNSVTNVLQTATSPTGAFIKDNVSFSEYVPAADVWSGGLSDISYAPRYMYFSENKDSLCLEGIPHAPANSPIDIKKGWNWLGFVPQLGTSINRALESLSPLNGDLIKSQTQFAQYIAGFGWLGDLNFMEPPKGYLLYISQPGTLEYPNVNVAESFAGGRSSDKTPWEIQTNLYQHSMNTVGILKGIDRLKEGDEIGVFVGEELRGKGKAIFVEPMNAYMAFITSYANIDGEALSFAYYDQTTSEIIQLNETLTFNADERIGRITDPFIFTVGEETEDAFITSTNDLVNLEGLTVYPNPAQDEIFISFNWKATEDLQIQVTDMLGRVLSEQGVTIAAGISTLSWDTNQLADGLYLLRFRNETGERTEKIMIKYFALINSVNFRKWIFSIDFL